MDLCTFDLDGRRFGVEIGQVKEVVRHASVARVPHAPPDAAGFVNVRGRIHLVVDLRRLFGFRPSEARSDADLVLFKPEVDEALGVQVDSLGEVVRVDPASIEDRRAGEAAGADAEHDERRKARQGISRGVARTPGGLIVLLEPDEILHALGEEKQRTEKEERC
jgi:purine-binding chemotaxis protein CheW